MFSMNASLERSSLLFTFYIIDFGSFIYTIFVSLSSFRFKLLNSKINLLNSLLVWKQFYYSFSSFSNILDLYKSTRLNLKE